jgi:thymidylate synthase
MIDSIQDIREQFVSKYMNGDITSSNDGVKTIDIINANFIVDEDTIFCKVNEEYVANELKWYLSQSLNVYDIPGKIPVIWKNVADKDGFINSNYGWCIFSKENDNQYRNCLRQLIADPMTRRACMIYTRPSMQYDYNKNGMSDFMCTFSTQQFLRRVKLAGDNHKPVYKLVYIVYQRSCDSVYGFRNDAAWHKYVAKRLIEDLRNNGYNLEDEPEIRFCVGSLHIYERHFKFIDEYIEQHKSKYYNEQTT